MTATIIDGKQIAHEYCLLTKKYIMQLNRRHHIVPALAVIMVGNNHASSIYVRRKIEKCEELGIKSYKYHLAESIKDKDLLHIISKINEEKKIHGLLVQLPLPRHINTSGIINSINPIKDVDGFNIINVGKLYTNQECLTPCTPEGILMLIKNHYPRLNGKHVVIVGRSNIVGKPLIPMLMSENATVTIAHSHTKNLASITRQADILIVAVGKKNLIDAQMVREGSMVIDVGVNRDENNKIVGDVNFDLVKEKAAYITPVPGGVGPMTIAMLMHNTLHACLMQNNLTLNDL